MEESKVHGGSRRRGLRRAHYQRHQVWVLRRIDRSICRGTGSLEHADRRPIYLPREYAGDHRAAFAKDLSAGTEDSSASRPDRSGGEKDSICGGGGEETSADGGTEETEVEVRCS